MATYTCTEIVDVEPVEGGGGRIRSCGKEAVVLVSPICGHWLGEDPSPACEEHATSPRCPDCENARM